MCLKKYLVFFPMVILNLDPYLSSNQRWLDGITVQASVY